jgi:hypothetical protein
MDEAAMRQSGATACLPAAQAYILPIVKITINQFSWEFWLTGVLFNRQVR